MADAPLRLVRIARNAKRFADPTVLKERLREDFQAVLERGFATYERILTGKGVGSFGNSVASGRLLRAFVRSLNEVYYLRNGKLFFSFAIRPSRATLNYGDPAEYYAALDDGSRRAGGPSTRRVRQWLINRGIITQGDKHASIRGKRVPVKRLIFIVQRSIWRSNARRSFKSLRITDALARVVDLENPNSFLRRRIKDRLSIEIFGKD